MLQLEVLRQLLDKHPEYREGSQKVYFVLVGGCRNADDQSIVDGLRRRCGELGLEENTRFVVNAPYAEVVSLLSRASVGLHTMTNEHFGISVVEFMAAGVIPVAHNSAGPKMDIVTVDGTEKTGYLATTANEYAERVSEALRLGGDASVQMRLRARRAALDRFSVAAFQDHFVRSIAKANQQPLRPSTAAQRPTATAGSAKED
ncbi:asparagine-linked glycosylation protein [Cladochytrium tenue]|nr:asparagine-linked glycosylation protein [Cladochytrium tenue]